MQVVLDCSGKFLSGAKLQPYLDAGAKKVVVSGGLRGGAGREGGSIAWQRGCSGLRRLCLQAGAKQVVVSFGAV